MCFSLAMMAVTVWAAASGFGFSLNPDLHMEMQVLQAPKPGTGFMLIAHSSAGEVSIKGQPMKRALADHIAGVEMANIANLYKTRGNPYRGQISELVVCQKEFMPRHARVTWAGQTRPLLVAGATGRRLFGACVAEQIVYWAGYFNFYDPATERLIEVRLFTKATKPSRAGLDAVVVKLAQFAEKILVKAP